MADARLPRDPAARGSRHPAAARLRADHFEYFVLAVLSEAPDRRLRLSELAHQANASLSRLSHVVTRLEKRGWARRETVAGTRGAFAVLTDEGYDKVVEAAPGMSPPFRRWSSRAWTTSRSCSCRPWARHSSISSTGASRPAPARPSRMAAEPASSGPSAWGGMLTLTPGAVLYRAPEATPICTRTMPCRS